jgi:N-acetylmuramoyl-L-alanine amidase
MFVAWLSLQGQRLTRERMRCTFFWGHHKGKQRWGVFLPLILAGFLCSVVLYSLPATGKRKPLRFLQDIRYSEQEDYTRIVLRISGTVQIEEGEAPAVLHQGLPPRLYVDLTPCIPQRRWRQQSIAMKSARLRKIRVGRHTLETTRIVFELGEVKKYQVTVLTGPMRIVVDLADRDLPPRPNSQTRLPAQAVPLSLSSTMKRPSVIPPKGRLRKPAFKRWGSDQPPAERKPYVLRYDGELRLPMPVTIQRIAIDPGHGGREEGAIGYKTKIREKTLTLDISKRLIRWLRPRTKVELFLTRDRDQHISLTRRAALIKQRKADLLVSVHINANRDRSLQGLSTYLLNWDERFYAAQLLSSDPLLARENQGIDPRMFQDVKMILNEMQVQHHAVISKVLGVAIQRGMLSSVRGSYPQARDLGVRSGLFYLLFAAEVPGVLVEASFLSNAQEEALLRTKRYREKIAQGIGQGLLRFLEVAGKRK